MSVRFCSFFLAWCLAQGQFAESSVCSRANGVGFCAPLFQYEGGLPRSKWIFGFAFKVAWPRCGRAPLACCWCRGARTSKQELKVVRGASNTLPSLVAGALRQAVWRRRTGSVAFFQGPEIHVSCAFVCDVCFSLWSIW